MKTLRRPQFRYGIVVLGAISAWYLLFAFRPIAMSLKMALTDYKLLDPSHSPWVGAEHFKSLLGYSLFWIAAENTVRYALMITLTMIPLALVLAMALTNVRGRGFYQGAIFLPVVVSMAAIALMFRHLMNPGGILNHLLITAGFRPWKWLVGADSALPSVSAIAVWKSLGANTVIILAGLLSIPEELYDAARVDGAGVWKRFRHITLPLLGPTLKLVLVLVTIGSLQAYTSVIILTNGGPANATFMMNQFIVEEAFNHFRLSLASAASFVLLIAILAISVFQLRMMKTEWEY